MRASLCCFSFCFELSIHVMVVHRAIMTRALSAALLLFQTGVVAFAAVGCGDDDGDYPLLSEVATQFGTSYCKTLRKCVGSAGFDLSYPGGIEECASLTFRIFDADERSVCSRERWDTCSADLEKSGCSPTRTGAMRPVIPQSCKGC